MSDGGNTVPRITKAEHIGQNDTGDNIEAKRVANYIWNAGTSLWERQTASGGGSATDVNVHDGSGNAITSTAGALDVNASVSIDTTGLASDTNQTNGAQKSQLVDAGGEAATVTGGKLDVNASVDTTGLALAANQQTDALTNTQLRATAVPVSVSGVATAAKQDTGNTSLASLDTKLPSQGQALAAASTPVVLPAAQITTLTPPAAITGFATSTKQDSLLTELQLKADLTETQPVSLASVPSHAVTNAGSFAVQAAEADGSNVTLGAKADAKNAATDTTPVTAMSVLKQISASVQAPPSQAVTNTGTFATQATLATETTKVIGAINNLPGTVDTNSGNKSASTLRVVLATDQPQLTNKLLVTPDVNSAVNNAQIAGNTISAGNGASGTGVQRVTIASDSTGQVSPSASSTATGTSIYKNTALSGTKAAANASGGNLYGYHIYNPNTTIAYVQFFNVASASVTVGTTVADMILAIPPSGWADATTSGPPIAFATAMTVAATTTATGSTNPSTGLLVNLWYK